MEYLLNLYTQVNKDQIIWNRESSCYLLKKSQNNMLSLHFTCHAQFVSQESI